MRTAFLVPSLIFFIVSCQSTSMKREVDFRCAVELVEPLDFENRLESHSELKSIRSSFKRVLREKFGRGVYLVENGSEEFDVRVNIVRAYITVNYLAVSANVVIYPEYSNSNSMIDEYFRGTEVLGTYFNFDAKVDAFESALGQALDKMTERQTGICT